MKIYNKHSMVSSKHIREIEKQLKKLGSKVDEQFMDGKEHTLENVLFYALGTGTYGVTVDSINAIKTTDFEINLS